MSPLSLSTLLSLALVGCLSLYLKYVSLSFLGTGNLSCCLEELSAWPVLCSLRWNPSGRLSRSVDTSMLRRNVLLVGGAGFFCLHRFENYYRMLYNIIMRLLFVMCWFPSKQDSSRHSLGIMGKGKNFRQSSM